MDHLGAGAAVAAEVDLPGGEEGAGVDVGVALKLHLGRLEREYSELRRLLTPPDPPTFIPLDGNGTVGNGSTYQFIALGGPTSPDHVWEIMRYWVTGNDPTATLAGVSVISFMYQGRLRDGANLPDPLPMLIEPSGTVPNSATYGRRQLVVPGGYTLTLMLKGLASGQRIFAGGLAIQYPKSTYFRE